MRSTIIVAVFVLLGALANQARSEILFQDDFDGPLSWTTNDDSVYVADGKLIIDTGNPAYNDYAERLIDIGLSPTNQIEILQRVKLVSGGSNYRLPWEYVVFEDSSRLITSYLHSDSRGWVFGMWSDGWELTDVWTHNTTNGVPAEDVWAVTKIVLTPTGGELFVKPDDASANWFSDDYSSVASVSWSHSQITAIRFDQPWNSVNNIDYIVIESTVPEPATLSLLALGGLAMLRRRK